MCKNNNRLISDEQNFLQIISLQDYVKRLWNHSNTKIPVTIGKGTDTAKPRSKAPTRGNNSHLSDNSFSSELLMSSKKSGDIFVNNIENHLIKSVFEI